MGDHTMPASQPHQMPQPSGGGPYPPTDAGVGGMPTVNTDIPVCAVLTFIFLCFAIADSTIFIRNQRRGHKFMLSASLAGFSMLRIVTLVLRIAWATRPYNIRLAIAAQIFVNAGTLVLYATNFILAQRILRAKQPQVGWHPAVRIASKALYVSLGGALVMVITSVVVSFYTLDLHTRSQCRDIQLAALTFLLVFTCLPLAQLAAAFAPPRSRDEETFGTGKMRTKLIVVTLASLLCILIAGFKAGVNWSPPLPIYEPAWYDSKGCFYVFPFACEIFTLWVLTVSRIDKRFFVPNGCHGPCDYTRLGEKADRGEEHSETGVVVTSHVVESSKF